MADPDNESTIKLKADVKEAVDGFKKLETEYRTALQNLARATKAGLDPASAEFAQLERRVKETGAELIAAGEKGKGAMERLAVATGKPSSAMTTLEGKIIATRAEMVAFGAKSEAATLAAAQGAEGLGTKLLALKSILIAVAASSIALKLREFFSGAIEQASEAEDAIGEVERLIKSTGGTAERTAEQLQGAATALADISVYDDDEILAKTTATLLRFGTLSGETFDRAQRDAVDLAAVLKTDLAAAAELLGKALLSPGEGLRALKQAGVDFNEDQIKTLQTLTDVGEAATAQVVILQEVERVTANAAADARKRLSGTLEAIKRDFGELQQEFGQGFASGLTAGLDDADAALLRAKVDARDTGVAVGELVTAIRPLIPILADVASWGAEAWRAQAGGITIVSDLIKTVSGDLASLVADSPLRALVDEVAEVLGKIELAAERLTAVSIPGLDAIQIAIGGVGKAAGILHDSLVRSAEPVKKLGEAADESNAPMLVFGETIDVVAEAIDKVPARARAAGESIARDLAGGADTARKSLEELANAAEAAVESRGGGLFGSKPSDVDSLTKRRDALQGTIDDLKAQQAQGSLTGEQLGELTQAEDELASVNTKLKNATLDVNTAIAAQALSAQETVQPVNAAADVLSRYGATAVEAGSALMEGAGNVHDFSTQLDGLPPLAESAAEGIGIVGDASRAGAEEFDNLNVAQRAWVEGAAAAIGPVEGLEGALAGFAARQQEGIDTSQGLAEAVSKTADELARLKETNPVAYMEEYAKAQRICLQLQKDINVELGTTKTLWGEIVALVHESEAAAA